MLSVNFLKVLSIVYFTLGRIEYVDVSSTDKYKYIRIDVHNNTGGTYNSLTEIKVYRGDSK